MEEKGRGFSTFLCDVIITLPLLMGVPLDANLTLGRLPHDLDAEHAIGEVGTVEGEFEVAVYARYEHLPLGRESIIQDINVEYRFHRPPKFQHIIVVTPFHRPPKFQH